MKPNGPLFIQMVLSATSASWPAHVSSNTVPHPCQQSTSTRLTHCSHKQPHAWHTPTHFQHMPKHILSICQYFAESVYYNLNNYKIFLFIGVHFAGLVASIVKL
ncbi:hypothetical protein Leryth_026909 [Lithospermum erythrorhizon]|nr:hypothetical protein Leryth_026909 [Lithospermum erythrorhizon]